tara:strand:+ start:560 stop:700 length:141 start_codon:yes stop_codon:yes gene_type:complete
MSKELKKLEYWLGELAYVDEQRMSSDGVYYLDKVYKWLYRLKNKGG